MNTMTLIQVSTFIGLWISFFFTAVGISSTVTMFINRDQSLGRISLWGGMVAFGITLTIAILKPI